VRNISYILAFMGVLMQLAAAAAWWNIFRQPEPAPTAGRLQRATGRANLAAIAAMGAFGLCAVAAILAIISWMV
jgi:hypothetical protein